MNIKRGKETVLGGRLPGMVANEKVSEVGP